MPTILDRLLGRTPAEKAVTTGSGGTGPGVVAFYNDVPVWSASRNPRRLMRQAQELYHSPGWVYPAEHRVSSTAAGVQWHLEEDDEEITDESAPELVAIRDLFEQPQALVPIRMKHLTRRSMWQVTLRHEGLCGTAFWYKDQRDDFGIPRSFLYINPARMWAVYDTAGNTVGWKLDTDDQGNGGVPLDLDEVLQFDYDPPDNGAYGIGLVESAGVKAHMSQMADRHISGVLGSGGRLSGIISPKEGSIVSDDQWAALVRDYRNITEDPDAAKRLQIAKAPIEYQRTTATLQELQVEAVAKMSREDVFAHWMVPLSQIGITTAGGLNSGETKGYDEAVLWQGAIHARLTPFKEMLQYGFLDQVARNGGPKVELVIEEPEFDDETPLFDRAQKAESQPLTRNERRAILNLDPLPDFELDEITPLGVAIDIPSNIVTIGAGPDKDGKLRKPPPEPEPPPAPALLDVLPVEEVPVPALKARTTPLEGLRRSLDTRWTPAVRKAVAGALRDQAKAVASRVRAKGAHIKAKPTDTTVWWNPKSEDERLRKVVEPRSVGIAEQVAKQTRSVLRPGKAEFASTVAERVRLSTGERIVGINETTREAVAQLIAQGFDDGLSPAQVGDLIEDAASFNEARAEMIARTESALAYNEAAIRSFEEFGVTEVEAIDGDEDAECAERNGKVYPLDEALGITDHPNGTLDWAPVLMGKAAPPDPLAEAMKAMVEFAQRPQPEIPAPVVNNYVNTPDVNVTSPAITVQPAEVTVNIPEPKPRTRKVKHDANGRIIEVTET